MIKILLFTLLTTAIILAQITGSNYNSYSKSQAMGNTYVASSRGINCLGYNPANLVFARNNDLEFSTFLPIPTITVSAGNNSISLDDVDYFFTPIDSNNTKIAKTLTKNDKQRFKDLFSSDLTLYSNFSLNFISFSYKPSEKFGSFAFSMNENSNMRFDVPKDLPSSLVDAGILSENSYTDLNAFNLQGWWIRDYSVAYARDFKKELCSIFNINQNKISRFALGFSLKYISGFAYVGTTSSSGYIKNTIDSANSIFETSVHLNTKANMAISGALGPDYDFNKNTLDVHAPLQPFPKEAGRGFGYDFGISTQFNDNLQVSFAVTDIGSIKWFKNLAQYTIDGNFTYSGFTFKSGYYNAFKDSLQNTLDTLDKFSKSNSFYTDLPTAIRFGIALQVDKVINNFPGIMTFALDINQGLNNMPGNSKKTRFSFGFDWDFAANWPYLRSGVSLGGYYGFSWSLGTGFELSNYQIDLAFIDLQDLLRTNKIHNGVVSIGTRWKF